MHGTNCPYCSNKRVLIGYNDLSTTNQKLLKEWDYGRNGSLTPAMVTAGSNKKVWWKCDKGHSWQASIYSRRNTGCPICSNKEVKIGFNDLSTTNPQLASEWDYEKNGSLTPEMVTSHSNKIVWWRCDKGHSWQVSVNNRKNGTGCPFCSNKKILIGYNDLPTTNPELLKEWDYKNNILSPYEVHSGSTKAVWWKCEKGHSYVSKILYRSRGTGCPYCANQKVLEGYNDLETTNPILLKEWDFERNVGNTPQMFVAGSEKKVWWKCDKGHSWQSAINKRVRGEACPYCSNRKVLEGFNDLMTTNPKLASEWDYEKNGSLTPEMVTAGSDKKVGWKCKEGHTWQSRICDRNRGRDCPQCKRHMRKRDDS